MNFFTKSKFFLIFTVFAFAIAVFLVTAKSAQATVTSDQTFSATASLSSIKHIRVDPANGQAYVFGLATGTFGAFSLDGTTYTNYSYNVALPSMSTIGAVVSNGRVFIVISAASTNVLYRYEISGSVANFLASTSLAVAGSANLALGSGETLYTSKSTSVYTHDFDLNSLGSVHTVSTVPTRSAYAAGEFYYITTTGLFRRNDLNGTDTLIASGGPNSTNVRGLAMPSNAGALYFASSTGFAKMTPAGEILWRSDVANLGAFDLNTSTGRITTITTSGAVQTYLPINAVSSLAITTNSSDAGLSWITGVGDGDYSGVTIRRSQSGYPTSATDGTAVTSSAMVSSFTDSGLSDGTYYYSIFNQTSDGFYSSAVTSSVTIDATPPDAPILGATRSGNTVSLTWTTPADTASFVLRRSSSGYPASIAEGTAVTSTDMSVTSFEQSGVEDGTWYYSVFAGDSNGNYSNAGTASVTIDTVGPSAPTLTASPIGSMVDLSWDSPLGAVSFVLRRSSSGFPSSVSDGTGVTTTILTSLVQSGVEDGTWYYSVFAADAYGNYSSAGTSTAIVDTTAPFAPTDFVAAVSGSTVSLTWTNPVADFASSKIRRSTTRYPISTTDGTSVVSTSGTSYSDVALANAVYYYSIFAIDSYGNTSDYVTSTATVYVASTSASTSSGSVIAVAPSAATGGTPLSFSVAPITKPVLTLQLNANPNTVRGYAVSLEPTFKNAIILPYKADTIATVTLPNKAGTYTVYLKYFSVTGIASEVLTQTVSYSASTVLTSPSVPLKRVLRVGSKGDDVKALQQFLNANGFVVAPIGAGSPGNETNVFGPATTKALIKFQEAYAAQILKPLGLKKGTGVLGTATIKVIGTI